MKTFTKRLKRQIRIRASDPALDDTDWVLTLDEHGVGFHRLGNRSDRWRLAWRSVIGVALIHTRKLDPDPPQSGPEPPPKRRRRKNRP